MSKKKPQIETVYKATRPDGTDFKTGTINYADALAKGIAVEVLDAHSAEEAAKHRRTSESVCGHGLHVSPTAHQTIQFSDRNRRPWRWFEGTVETTDVIERDAQKFRVKRFKPTKEIFLADIFGNDLAERVQAVRESILTWKTIPWLKPPKVVKNAVVIGLLNEWRTALTLWLPKGTSLPEKVKIVRDRADIAAAAAAAAAADIAAAVAAAVADIADIWVNWRYRRWYMRPYYILRRDAYWRIVGIPDASPWGPLVQLFAMGCAPIGFVDGEFVVYVPTKKRKIESPAPCNPTELGN